MQYNNVIFKLLDLSKRNAQCSTGYYLYLVEKGFKDVYQMDGGIWNYITQHPDSNQLSAFS
jgi:hypothetical protein